MTQQERLDAISDVDCSSTYEERNSTQLMTRLISVNALYLLGAAPNPALLIAGFHQNLATNNGFRHPRNDN